MKRSYHWAFASIFLFAGQACAEPRSASSTAGSNSWLMGFTTEGCRRRRSHRRSATASYRCDSTCRGCRERLRGIRKRGLAGEDRAGVRGLWDATSAAGAAAVPGIWREFPEVNGGAENVAGDAGHFLPMHAWFEGNRKRARHARSQGLARPPEFIRSVSFPSCRVSAIPVMKTQSFAPPGNSDAFASRHCGEPFR